MDVLSIALALEGLFKKTVRFPKALVTRCGEHFNVLPERVSLLKETREALHLQVLLSSPLTILTGVSGGADSTALLSVFSIVKEFLPLNLKVLHVNYRLRGKESRRDMEFVQSLGAQFGVDVNVCTVSDEQRDWLVQGNLQSCARDLRMSLFKKELQFLNGMIALGHNLTDNCETFLMRLMSGGGGQGLSSMNVYSPDIIRPFLQTEREDIERFLSLNHIDFVNDSSNSTGKYKRNRIRNELIPLMESISHGSIYGIERSRTLISQDNDCLEKMAFHALKGVLRNEFCGGLSLSVDDLKQLDRAMSSRILRKVFRLVSSSDELHPSFNIISELHRMIEKGENSRSSLRKHLNIFLYRKRLYFFPHEGTFPPSGPWSVTVDLKSCPENGTMVFNTEYWKISIERIRDNGGLQKARAFYDDVSGKDLVYIFEGSIQEKLTFRSPLFEDVIVLQERTKKVSKVLSEKGVPLPLRKIWPLVVVCNKVVSIAGLRVSTSKDFSDHETGMYFISFTSASNESPGNCFNACAGV